MPDETEVKQQPCKQEADCCHPASHYLVVEDKEKVTTWHLRIKDCSGQYDRRLVGAAWAATHDGYRGNVYQGPGKEAAIKELERIYREVFDVEPPKSLAEVKVLSVTDDTLTVGGYGIVFGGHDLEGDVFAPDTDLMLDAVPQKPVFYDHTLRDIKTRLGATITEKIDDIGVWVEAELDRHLDYVRMVEELVKRGALGWSSGAVAHLVRRDGPVIKSWPVFEYSLTPTPAEPRTLGVEIIKSLSAQYPEFKAFLPETPENGVADAEGDSAESTSLKSLEETTMENEYILTPEQVTEMLNQAAEKAAKAAIEEFAKRTPATKKPEVKVVADHTGVENAVKQLSEYWRTGKKPQYVINEVKAAAGDFDVWIPEEWTNDLTQERLDNSLVRIAGATQRVISGVDAVSVPKLLIGSDEADYIAKAGNFPVMNPNGEKDVFNPFKFGFISVVNEEDLADSKVNIEQQVMPAYSAQVFYNTENHHFVMGDGTNGPLGIVYGTAPGHTLSAIGQITADDVYEVFYNLNHNYRSRAVWMMNDATAKKLMTLRDSEGEPLWHRSMEFGQPPTLLGRPVVTVNTMDGPDEPGGKIIWFGDPSYYYIYDFGNRRVYTQRLNELYAATGQVGFRFYVRFDGKFVLPQARTALANPMSASKAKTKGK